MGAEDAKLGAPKPLTAGDNAPCFVLPNPNGTLISSAELLSNLAAGVMLLIFRPFKIGHKVQIGGSTGIVKELSLFWTELVTDDKVQVIVPNGGVWGQPLRNYSIYPAPPNLGEMRLRIVEYTDLETAIARMCGLLDADPRVLNDPAPRVLIDGTGDDSSLVMVVTFAATGDDTGIVKSDLFRAAHGRLTGLYQESAEIDGARPPAIGGTHWQRRGTGVQDRSRRSHSRVNSAA